MPDYGFSTVPKCTACDNNRHTLLNFTYGILLTITKQP